jgi:pyruvate,water dikinase
MTPSTWSLWWIFHYETNPVHFPGDYPLCGNIGGRPYINLSLLASMFHAIGRDVRKELQGDLIGSTPDGLEIPLLPFSAFQVYRTVLPGALKAHWRMSQDEGQIQKFVATMPDWCRATGESIQKCANAPALLALWREGLRPVIMRICRILRSVTMLLGEPGTKLRLDMVNLVGTADANALLSNLSGDSAALESLGPLLGLSNVQDGKLSRADYMTRYGHRGPHEMELFLPGADDDPDWFEKQVADFTRSAVDVDALLAKQRAEYSSAWGRFAAKFPHKVKATRRALDKVAAAAKNREAVRSEVTRATRLLRRFLLRAGEVAGLGDGIFFLSLDEMAETLAGDKSSAARISSRREAYEKYCSLPPYPPIIIGRFDPFQWVTTPNRRSDYFDARQTVTSKTASIIKGFAGASGCVEGIVRRIDCVEEGNQILPGEILVTTITNIGWTPLFPRLAAIVTDVGAPLSHAAIVAREMGIPAVVGCGNATMLLKTGDHIRVDGGRGVVEVLKQ